MWMEQGSAACLRFLRPKFEPQPSCNGASRLRSSVLSFPYRTKKRPGPAAKQYGVPWAWGWWLFTL